jgi:hypothetical protein
MSAPDDDIEGIRGGKLAEGAGSANRVSPNPDDLAADGVRGDGLADGADLAGDTAPDPNETEGGIRGDELATDA